MNILRESRANNLIQYYIQVASQVVQALLTQRRLQTECSQLRTQVHRLAISNTPDESPSPPAHGMRYAVILLIATKASSN